jgi:glycerol kinase
MKSPKLPQAEKACAARAGRANLPPMTDTILVLDEGTTSTRAALYDRALDRGGFAQEPVALVSPSADVVEQDPAAIWTASREMALRAAGGTKPAALGITNQRETTILWERATGRPIHAALVWQDRRGAELGAAMKADGREVTLSALSGLLADPYFSAFKLHWLFANVDGLRAAAGRGEIAFGTVDSWLIWNLTGGAVHATDASNASRTGLFDIHRQAWSEELLRLFDLPASILPDVRDSAGGFGETGLFGGATPILGVLGDQQAALMGQGCAAPGQAKITYGTGAFLMAQTGSEAKASANRLLTTVAWRLGGKVSYALEGAVLNAGTVVQWLRDGLGLFSASADVEALAASVPDTGGVHLVPAFTGLGAPHWAPQARGLVCGIGRGTTKAHIARAALEANALQTADLLSAAHWPPVRACRRRRAIVEPAGRRRDGGQRPLSANPGRSDRPAGRTPRRPRDDSARRRPCRRHRAGLARRTGRRGGRRGPGAVRAHARR